MNYGYEPVDDNCQRLELAASDEDDRYCIQLYHHVAGGVDLTDLDVLEVGSGRGGGASFIKRYLNAGTMTGVDFSAKAVTFCGQVHQLEGLSFCQGDAEALPFEEASFDAVVNVESSHCYGSMPAFLKQVERVLRPGGHFLFADFRAAADIELLTQHLQQSGMTIVEEEVITPGVVNALSLDSERKKSLISGQIRWWLSGTFQQFAGLKDSAVFRHFQDGGFVYKRFLLRKLRT